MAAYITQDTAVFHYDFGYGIRATTRFGITYSYIGTSVDPIKVEPSLSLDGGVTFTLIENLEFTLNQGVRKFSIKLMINNDPTTTKDYKVNLVVKPLENTAYFTNPSGMDTSVEFTNASSAAVIAVDSGINTVVDEGNHGVAKYTIAPALPGNTTVQVNVTPASALGLDIAHLQFSLDNVTWIDIPTTRQAVVTQGAEEFYIRFEAILDGIMLEDDETVGLILTEVSTPTRLIGTPLTKNFTIKDKTILPLGTFINWYCEGYKKMGRYSDGVGGFTTALIQANSPECGYVAAPYGTILSTYCANYNYYERVADGNDGYFIRVKTENVPNDPPNGCSYIEPVSVTPSDFTPTELDGFGVAIISNNKHGFASLRRDAARSKYGTLWGKWYWEVRISRPTEAYSAVSIGVATIAHNMASWIGADNSSWAWWPYDQTKYHGDVQQHYDGQANDGDIISVLLDMDNHKLELWSNGQTLGVLYSNIADEKIYAVFNAKDDSYCLVNFGERPFAYTPPAGYHPGFGMPLDPPIERGTIIRTYCDVYVKKQEVANGKYGSFINILEVDSRDCGYNPIPAAGTVLGYYCTGTTRYKRVADGLGGETQVLVEINSTTCGYVPPPVPALIPTNLDPAWKQTETDLSNNNLTALMKGAVRAVKSVYSGKWYWEVVLDTTDVIVGIGTTATGNTTSTLIGSNAISWGLNTADNTLVTGGATISVPYSFAQGDIIGMGLDFVNQRLKFSINGVWKDDLVFDNLPIVDYFPMISSTVAVPNPLPQATIHFGDNDLVFDVPAGYVPGLGATTTVYPRKGGIYTYFCTGLDRYVKKYDGGGGYYNEIYEVNSYTCGWRPPDPAGMLKSTYCVGYDQWGKYADGSYGLYNQLIESPSTNCGYKPAGTLLSTRCEGFTKIGTYSDGAVPYGMYDQLIAENSTDCGYTNGNTGGGNTGGGSTIDPNLPQTNTEGIIISRNVIPSSTDAIIIDTPLPP